MKKLTTTLAAIALSHSLVFSLDLKDLGQGLANNILGGTWSKIFDKLNEISGGAVGMCYMTDIQNYDVCSNFNDIGSMQTDMCAIAPSLPGTKKKQKQIGFGGYGLSAFCRAQINKLNNIIASVNNSQAFYDLTGNATLVNGLSLDAFYEKANPKIIFQTQKENFVKAVFRSGNQSEMNALINIQASNPQLQNGSFTDLSIDDVKAPETMKEYLGEVEGLTNSMLDGYVLGSPSNITGKLKQDLNGKKGSSAEKEANQYANKVNAKIDNSTKSLMFVTEQAMRQKEDIAMPTQQYVKYLKKDAKLRVIAQIKNQQQRQALIRMRIQEGGEIRKNLVALSAQKAVIANETFDKDAAEKEINQLIQ